jgi:hypothetical protein
MLVSSRGLVLGGVAYWLIREERPVSLTFLPSNWKSGLYVRQFPWLTSREVENGDSIPRRGDGEEDRPFLNMKARTENSPFLHHPGGRVITVVVRTIRPPTIKDKTLVCNACNTEWNLEPQRDRAVSIILLKSFPALWRRE